MSFLLLPGEKLTRYTNGLLIMIQEGNDNCQRHWFPESNLEELLEIINDNS